MICFFADKTHCNGGDFSLLAVCCILDQYAIPLLEKAAPLAKELGAMKEEKIADQMTFMNLQNKVIVKQDESLKSVQNAFQTTVKTGMQSYATAVSTSCSDAFAPKRIQTVVRKVAVRDVSIKNVIINGLRRKM